MAAMAGSENKRSIISVTINGVMAAAIAGNGEKKKATRQLWRKAQLMAAQ